MSGFTKRILSESTDFAAVESDRANCIYIIIDNALILHWVESDRVNCI